MSLPKTTKGWVVEGQGSFDNLKFDTQQPLPELSDNEVLVSSMQLLSTSAMS
jgi:hypothetical protein